MTHSIRASLLAFTLSLGTLVATPALAHDGNGAKFPMTAAEFKQKFDARAAKAKTRMEAHAAKLSPADAQALRTKFQAAQAKIDAEVQKVIADGTVTKDEAKAVRSLAHSLRGGDHGKCARHAT